MSSQPQFFSVEGTLDTGSPSYVVRPADFELLDNVRAGNFCYVLTARQMGKSSLMVRTARTLREQGFHTVQVDLSTIGAVSADEWYLSLLTQIARAVGLRLDTAAWWRERQAYSVAQRFTDFLRDVLLDVVTGQVALFFDELDTMLRLEFRDDFFAAIRAIYNARASNADFRRLTFVLLGVATPSELVRDPRRTPFNIGRRIELREFTLADATPLRQGLDSYHPGTGDRLLNRIFYWTNGHPYLTQRLCRAAVEAPTRISWNDQQVDRLVEACFFSPGSAGDANLTFVRTSVANVPADERRAMLALYEDVFQGKAIVHDESSPEQNHLELFGLVRVEQNRLLVRNGIYRRIFNEKWIRDQLAGRSRSFVMPLVIIAVVAALGIVGLAAQQAGYFEPTPTQVVVNDTATPSVSIDTPTIATPTLGTQPIPTPQPVSPEPTIATPSDTPVPPNTPVRPTIAPPVPPTPTASCVVGSEGITIRPAPNDNSTGLGSLEPGVTFVPVASSTTDRRFMWVRVQGLGWVYAGTSEGLVRCTGLENVPVNPDA